MKPFFNIVKTMGEEIDIFKNIKSKFPVNIPHKEKRSEEMNKVMSNEELIKTLRLLKKDGISFRYIARKCDIRETTFYGYINKGEFPFFVREKLTEYINTCLKGVIENNV